MGLGQTERCEENNYRNFEPDDALEYGNALMLRSFDMNLKEISQTQSGQSVNEMGVWLEEHVRELEEHLRLEQIRLARLREMQRYWRTLGCGTGKATFTDQLANYEIWSFDLSRELTREEILGAQELTRRLLELDRGVTLLQGKGAYSGKDKQVILCACARTQIIPVKRAVQEIDPDAFVIVCDAHEILGEGFGVYAPGGL